MRIYFIEEGNDPVRISSYADAVPHVGDEIMVESFGNPLIKKENSELQQIYGVVKEVRWSFLAGNNEINTNNKIDIKKWANKFFRWGFNKTVGFDIELNNGIQNETQFVFVVFNRI